ncbi:MAG TPA: transcription-repair coupling factor [candidate division Zixibacteria bacterium]|nr:transcription-repair coupling factor [candidate division Zixibacteria bacterium]
MALSAIRRKIQLSEPFKQLGETIAQGEIPELSGASGLGTAILADYIVRELGRTVLWVSDEDINTRRPDSIALAGEERVLAFPEWDIDPYEHRHPSEEIVATRLDTMLRISDGEPRIILATPKSLLIPTISPTALDEMTIRLSVGDEIAPDELIERLVAIGYEREELVEFLGAVSRRGDVVDVFTAMHRDPVRLEFFGDTIESIRTFSAENQRSRAKLISVEIPPAVEWARKFWQAKECSREELIPEIAKNLDSEQIEEVIDRMAVDRNFPGSLWLSGLFEPRLAWPEEHLPKDSILLIEEPDALMDSADNFLAIAEKHNAELAREDEIHIPPREIFPDSKLLAERLSRHSVIPVRHFGTEERTIDLGFREIPAGFEGPVAFRKALEKFRAEDCDISIVCQDDFQLRRLPELMPEITHPPAFIDEISSGFQHKPSGEVIITGWTIFGRRRRKAQRKHYREGSVYALPTGLAQGDLVVHSDHGIGKFLGTETLESRGFTAECLVLLYADGERLFVPVEDFHLVQKYLGGESAPLARLGGTAWVKAKEKARAGIMALAGELVQLYALREISSGFSAPPEDDLSTALAESFKFDETDDQLKSIAEVIADMERPRPMDRLLVGDVGFGKTEVAIRAAFKATRGGKQVAVLVPTTVLAEQHYRTFRERLEGLPVNVDMLSRFRSPKEQKKTVAGLADGSVDILIATHRLLSKDIQFKDLGLLIIDEEQRFGVKHKERIKKWRSKIDVLTMTATPIPRTMYLSLAGVRDMSIIDTPPAHRQPIYTRVVPFSGEAIADAINTEIERGGQVFFLHNRVASIEAMAHYLRTLVPKARFAVAHGQMKEGELSDIIMDFLAGKFDVLITTTIIESGTDIPNVNTILINRADRFGVAQLYQLRGRVGRSDAQAFCYLMAPPYKNLPIKAKKRLKALLDHSDLGSGFALAMRDLEIRGAGNLLGAQQHGFIEEIGLDLYTKMLSEAVATLKGEAPPHFSPVSTQIDVPLLIPKEYMPSAKMRIEFYQRLYMAPTDAKLAEVKAEIHDRFGSAPPEVLLLLTYLKMRLSASSVKIPLKEVILRKGKGIFLFEHGWSPTLAEIDRAISPLKLKADFRRNPFELRFELTGDHATDLLHLRNIAERLSKI